MGAVLYHFSEDPTIEVFVPRRAREKSATGVSTGTAAVPAAVLAGARCAKPGRASRDDVPQGLRRLAPLPSG